MSRHATLSGAGVLPGEPPRVRHGTLSSEHRPGTIGSSKVEDDDSGVDPEEGSEELSLNCLVSFINLLSRSLIVFFVFFSVQSRYGPVPFDLPNPAKIL